VKLFKEKLALFTEEEMLSSWDGASSTDEKIEAIVRLGVASFDQPPEPYMSRIAQALDDADPAVRDAGLVAFSHSLWTQMRSRIEQLRDRDPDPGVQQRARLLLEAWTSRPD
jgi:sugar phosphate isomerase/epimerase